ncbi:MAG TPA: TIGR00730 family Rossman fold protein [Dehalococcoidia bacterium]|nr:TIGR00730 family Rossman fold protein [Dehalococcoidia bacterium]
MAEEIWGKIPVHPDERKFLAGPHPRGSELLRVMRIAWEFIRGFRKLHFVGPCVTVFGSSKFKEGHPYYEQARELGRLLAMEGFTVMTGGGPGIMEAANRGAKEAGGRSIGCNITLPEEQKPNPYLDEWITFRYFFVRKVMLLKYSYAFVSCPGGLGTMDETFEALTLIQTRKIRDFPVLLMGQDFWLPLLDYMRNTFLGHRTVEPEDLEYLMLVDSAVQATEIIRDIAIPKFGLTYLPRPKRRRLLCE